MAKAYSYTRFSTPEQARGDSLRRQVALAEAYSASHGLDLDAELTFRDLGISAFRGANVETGRLADFLEAVRVGLVPPGSYLLVESLDRISRAAARRALRVLEDLCDAGITVVTLSDNREYTAQALDSDPMALMMSLLIFIRANEESAMKAARLKAAWAHKREIAAEVPMTATAPSWLRLVDGHWEIIEDRAEVLRRIFRLAAEGVGQHAIAERLNRDAIPVFGRGTFWHETFITRLLHSPAVIGTMVPHSVEYVSGKRRRIPQVPIEGYFPAIVDPTLYQAVTSLLTTKAPLRGRHATAGQLRNVLGGLAACPLCGSTMTLVHKGKRSRLKLVCTKAKAGAGCRYHSVDYAGIEHALVTHAARLVAEAPAGTNGAEDAAAGLQAAAWAKQDELENLLSSVASGALASTPTLAGRITRTEAEVVELRRDLAAAEAELAVSRGPLVASRLAELAAALQAQPLDRQRANTALRQLLTRVVIDWPNGALLLHWRHDNTTELTYAMPPHREPSPSFAASATAR